MSFQAIRSLRPTTQFLETWIRSPVEMFLAGVLSHADMARPVSFTMFVTPKGNCTYILPRVDELQLFIFIVTFTFSMKCNKNTNSYPTVVEE